MRKLITLLGLTLLAGFSFGQVAKFDVSVGKSPVNTNEPVDFTIKAVDSNGNVVEDYNTEIIMEAKDQDGNSMAKHITFPNNGIYSFTTEDQGTKKFSKGLIARKSGEYSIIVYGLMNESAKGKDSLVVKDNVDDVNGTISISSPAVGSEEKDLPISVVAESNLSNTPYEIYVDGNKAGEGMTNGNGQINNNLTDIKEGEHTLKIKILDANDETVAESDELKFSYKPEDKDFFKSISVLPSNTVAVGDIITINVDSNENANSATVELDGLDSYPMDKAQGSGFTKELSIDESGKYSVSVDLSNGKNSKSYENVETITVKEVVSIKNVKYFVTGDSNLKVEWDSSGKINSYKLDYGNQESNLSKTKNVDNKEAIIEDYNPDEDLYLKVTPLNSNGESKGNASDLIEVDLNKGSHGAACVIEDITLSTEIEGDTRYLNWSSASGVNKYIVYKSNKDVSSVEDMQKVSETEKTQFEYPFDKEAEKDKYRNYAVVAECGEGETKQIDGIKNVKVGPMDTAMLFTLLAFLVYGFYRMYAFTRD